MFSPLCSSLGGKTVLGAGEKRKDLFEYVIDVTGKLVVEGISIGRVFMAISSLEDSFIMNYCDEHLSVLKNFPGLYCSVLCLLYMFWALPTVGWK